MNIFVKKQLGGFYYVSSATQYKTIVTFLKPSVIENHVIILLLLLLMMMIIIIIIIWNQAVHTDREVTANRPDIIIKNKKRENMHTDRSGNTRRQKCCAKGRGKNVEYILCLKYSVPIFVD